MQRRSAPSASASSSSIVNRGSNNTNNKQRPTLERSNSKTVRPSRSMLSVVLMAIFLPLLFTFLVFYSTHFLPLSSHDNDATVPRKTEAAGAAKKDYNRLGGVTAAAAKNNAAGAAAAVDTVSTTSGGFEYHIVFSTGCSLYQDWQSYVFFFQAMVTQQPGTVTRIVSGCDPDDERKMTEQFQDQIHPMAPGRFKIHFTPDYSKLPNGRSFVYWSKSVFFESRKCPSCRSIIFSQPIPCFLDHRQTIRHATLVRERSGISG